MTGNKIKQSIFFILILLILIPAARCPAQEDFEDTSLEDIMTGFDEVADDPSGGDPGAAVGETEGILSWLDINGYVRVGTCYNVDHHRPDPGLTDWRGFSRLDSENRLELKAGRQIVV